eukprot:jgi/Chrzof1/5344/Cz15g23080.t1
MSTVHARCATEAVELYSNAGHKLFAMIVTSRSSLIRFTSVKVFGSGITATRRRLRSIATCLPVRTPNCSPHFAKDHAHTTHRRQILRGIIGGDLLSAAVDITRGRSMAIAATPVLDVEKVLEDPKWPETWPFRPEDFLRYDEAPDGMFYEQPRFVYHIDDLAVKALTKYYGEVLPAAGSKDAAVLDICSSWVSHYPEGYTAGRISGLGMNEEELKRNVHLNDYIVHDLNQDPKLPYPDNSFDVVTNAVSVDYLNQPLQVFHEIHRVLKPGGTAIMSFSNRCFPTKAIALWTATGDEDHVWIVGSYFHYSVPGGFTEPVCKDITPGKQPKAGLFSKSFQSSDPMYVVYASKQA